LSELRFMVKKGIKRWVVWDVRENRVADHEGKPAIELSAETATWMARQLNLQILRSS
jgi:hypothetical protein